ncbi:hypothetical protein [Candidatus Palauibacter sp.]|uniref:hypothetical protein n=2 Tax=Candidatus Palauibacter sp. TaxID=3101350 RepID=UPI003B02CCCA
MSSEGAAGTRVPDLDLEQASHISEAVRAAITNALDPSSRFYSRRFPIQAFVVDMMRKAERDGVELSEDDLAELFAAALKVDASLRIGEQIGGVLGAPLKGGFVQSVDFRQMLLVR